MPYDALEILTTLVTKTASATHTGLDLGTGTPRRGLKARVIVTALMGSLSGAIFTPAIEHSTDNTTFTRLAQADPLTVVSTTTATAEVFIPFETSKRYVRAALDGSPTTGTPSISYRIDLGLSRP